MLQNASEKMVRHSPIIDIYIAKDGWDYRFSLTIGISYDDIYTDISIISQNAECIKKCFTPFSKSKNKIFISSNKLGSARRKTPIF